MLLGKRPRAPMTRTVSMNRITLDIVPQEPTDDGPLPVAGLAAPPEYVAAPPHDQRSFTTVTTTSSSLNGPNDCDQNYLAATDMVSPRRNPYGRVEYMETAQFLRICGLCQRRLFPGRDIYMYRGETAFCSQECREQQMKKDERKEKRTSAVASVSK